MGEIRAICISEQRGTKKYEIPQAELKEEWGIVGDAHAGHWHRQGSLLSQEKIAAFKLKGADIEYGAFGENLSDKGYAGEREDKSGPMAQQMLLEAGYEVVEMLILPDEQDRLERELIRLADQRQLHLILTTGGTGFSKRDITPEATIAVCDRMARGIAEAIRNYSMTITKRAMLSRAESGIRKGTLIVNLPGSPKAVREALEYILPELEHGIGILRGTEGECARK